MSSDADALLYNNSLKQDANSFLFENREMTYVVDSNSNSYPSGSITFDNLGILSNIQKNLCFPEAVLAIPTVMKVTGANITDDAMNAFSASWKNHAHMIHSIRCEIDNKSVVDPVEFSNVPCFFKQLSKLSEEELKQYGSSIGLYKDNAFSLRNGAMDTVHSPDNYEFNNDINSNVTTLATTVGYGNVAIAQFGSNPALMDRMVSTSCDITAGTLFAPVGDAMKKSGKATCVRSANTVVYHGIVTIPLKFLDSFFANMPKLVRGTVMRLTVNTNLISKTTLTVAGGVYTTCVSSLSAQTCPYNVCTIGAGLNVANGNFTIETGIGRLLDGTHTNPTYSSCRLYVPTYSLSPAIADSWFRQPPRKILYDAYYRSVTPPILAGQSLSSYLVTSGLSRIRSILIVPRVALGFNDALSPFSSSPSTTALFPFVSNMQVRVSGVPIYPDNTFYDWEHYQMELRETGVAEDETQKGLLSQAEWASAYRYYYINLSRKAGQGVDDMSKAIVVDLVNSCDNPIRYEIYVCYQKEINMSLSTGSLTN